VCSSDLIPSFRFEDLEREVDLFEEIARIYGYEKIPVRTPMVLSKQGKYTNEQKILRKIKDILIGMGLKEVINYSFISRKDLSFFSLDDEDDYKNYVKIMNPLNEDFEIMRTSLLQSLVKNAKDNIYKKINDIGIFEISKVFNSVVGNQNEKPLEKNVLAILLTGRRLLKSWNEQERFFDYYDLKGFLESLSELFYHKYELSIERREYKFFHPVISGNIVLRNKKMGIIGKMHPKIINALDIKQDIYFMEIDLDLFMDNMIMEKSYKQFSIFPSVNIDMAFIVDEELNCAEIEKEIISVSGKNLKSLRLFDLYRGKQIGENKKSLAFSLELSSPDRTLNDSDIEFLIKKVSEKLAAKFNAKLRDQ
jgi:phenylalanyl-tRNA synthetase beta chain